VIVGFGFGWLFLLRRLWLPRLVAYDCFLINLAESISERILRLRRRREVGGWLGRRFGWRRGRLCWCGRRGGFRCGWRWGNGGFGHSYTIFAGLLYCHAAGSGLDSVSGSCR